MYYEEKIIKGVLMYRTTPSGAWKQCSAERMSQRIVELEARVRELLESKSNDGVYEKAPWWANPNIDPPVITCDTRNA